MLGGQCGAFCVAGAWMLWQWMGFNAERSHNDPPLYNVVSSRLRDGRDVESYANQTKRLNRGTGSKTENLCLKRGRLDKKEDDGWDVFSFGAVGDKFFCHIYHGLRSPSLVISQVFTLLWDNLFLTCTLWLPGVGILILFHRLPETLNLDIIWDLKRKWIDVIRRLRNIMSPKRSNGKMWKLCEWKVEQTYPILVWDD